MCSKHDTCKWGRKVKLGIDWGRGCEWDRCGTKCGRAVSKCEGKKKSKSALNGSQQEHKCLIIEDLKILIFFEKKNAILRSTPPAPLARVVLGIK